MKNNAANSARFDVRPEPVHREDSDRIDGVERLKEGVVSVDAEGRVLQASGLARRIAREHDGIGLLNGRLLVAGKDAARQLRRALADIAAAVETNANVPARNFVVRRGNGRRPYLVFVRAAEKSGVGAAWRQQAVATIFIRDPEWRFDLDVELLAQSYDLSPAETELAAALDRGQELREIAGGRGVSITTVRSQLYALMSKLAVKRQTDLVRLFGRYCQA